MAGRFAKYGGALPSDGDFSPWSPDTFFNGGVPKPANNNDPFRRLPARPFGRAASAAEAEAAGSSFSRYFRYAGYFAAGYAAFQLVDGLLPYRGKFPRIIPNGHWEECKYPCYFPDGRWPGDRFRGTGFYWCDPDQYCISGQGITGFQYEGWPANEVYYGADAAPGTTFSIWFPYPLDGDPNSAGVWRQQHHRSWVKVGSAPGPYTFPHRSIDWFEPDPSNFERNRPSSPPVPDEPPAVQGGSDPNRGFNPRRPAPPRAGEREIKAKGPLRTLLRVMDIISEAAEVVDAIYDALPVAVRRKWKCSDIKRGLIDNAGQYGISAADCKARALWHNWHSVDVDRAVKNIIRNELQDKFLGYINSKLPKNIGHGVDDGMKELNSLFEDLMEELGL